MVKKKEVKKHETSLHRDNSCGVVGVVLGILSILVGSGGVVMGVVGLVFSVKQKRFAENKWSRAGIILNVIGIILGAILLFVAIYFAINGLPVTLSQLQSQGGY